MVDNSNVKEVADRAIETKPFEARSIISKLLLVLSPHVPDSSPVDIFLSAFAAVYVSMM